MNNFISQNGYAKLKDKNKTLNSLKLILNIGQCIRIVIAGMIVYVFNNE